MTTEPSAAEITVRQTLNLLDGDFREFADGVVEGHYAFWLGSGISLRRFPGLSELIIKVLEYLRQSANFDDECCRFQRAYHQAIALATLSKSELDRIDTAQPVDQWSICKTLSSRLTQRYADLLDVEIEGEEEDALIWDGLDVVGTYADDTVEPDAEHLCLAVLIREGIVKDLASANWDGLIEQAFAKITEGESPINVCVQATHLQAPERAARLLKFHGCAVMAREDEETYRSYIVGRRSQLNAWRDHPNTKPVFKVLQTIISTKPTLMLGLSAQDSNIQALFAAAQNVIPWDWPGDRPAYVFSQNDLGPDQAGLLTNVYHGKINQSNKAAIRKSAHLKAFAKPLLMALILYVLANKLERFAKLGVVETENEMLDWLNKGIAAIRDMVANACSDDALSSVETFIRGSANRQFLLHYGALATNSPYYFPLTTQTASKIEGDPVTKASGLPEAAIAVGILGQGLEENLWTLHEDTNDQTPTAFGSIKVGERVTRFVIAATVEASQELFNNGIIGKDHDAIVIHGQKIPDRMQRSSQRRVGRGGRLEPREVSIKEIFSESSTPNDLMERFKLEAAI